MSILFSEIYSKAIALFDDPKVTVAYETNTMQFQKIMYTFLQNAIGQFTNPVSVGIKVSKYIPPKGSMQTFRANGTDKVYRLDDAFEILDNSVYTYIEGDTRVEGKLDKENRTVEFENILKEGGQYAFEQYYCGEFTEDFSGLNSKTFAGDGLIEQEVKDEDVENEIKALQKRNARVILVERPAKEGDTVLLDYSGFVGDEQFEGGTAERQELKLGSGMFIPGFEEQLIGATPGEKKDVVVTFPEEYHAEDLAGKEAVFHCLVHEIKEEQLPELDDEFAKDVSEYDTLEELKKANRERLEAYAKAGSESQMKDAALVKAVEANEVDVPRTMVEDEMDRMCQELDQQLRYQGMSLQQYLQFTGKDMAAFRDELRPDAERQVKTRIVLMGIVDAEKIEVSEDEVEEELKVMAAQYNMTADKVKELIGAENLSFLKKDIQVKKAIDFIFDNAVIK